MKRKRVPVPFAGSQLTDFRHVCAFFNNEEEEYRALLPFIKDGFDAGQKAIHVVGPDRFEHHLERLTAAGIDWSTAQRSGQLDLRAATETYLMDGHFNQDRMLSVFEQLASGNDHGTFPFGRIFCRMDWAVKDGTDFDDVVEFESRVNDVWEQHDDVVVCTYHLPKFGGEAVINILRTHPMVIIGGILQQNPFFVPPKDFLSELRQRRADRTEFSSTRA